MKLELIKPLKALNKAFLKVKPNRAEIEGFKTNLITLLDRTNETESEEFHKNLVIDFLKKTYYDPNHYINTKGRNDLVIHIGNSAKSSVGVIIEAKKPTNKAEMITTKKLNTKAFQELVLYYLRERITHKNLEVKYLIATNINEWFIFDATIFDRLFAQNKVFVTQFNNFEEGRLADTKTDFFYKQVAEPFITEIITQIEFTYFNIQDYQKPLCNANKADDNSLIALFKLLSPEHLLKLPFANDSNSLDKRFYSELLHIIGLAETKEGSKKLIERNKPGERHTGTILEDAIIQLDSFDKLSRLEKPSQFGSTQQEKLFNVALELTITWINRILFLKLLEAQLITYHKGDKSYSFLNFDRIKNYNDLDSLFFQVLACKYDERNEDVKKSFEKVPYLNSSLFEPTDIEQVTLLISNLNDNKTIPLLPSSVLKDKEGKRRTGNLTTLEYLFEFLNAYDFSSEGSSAIQEDNKTLINASVLGLIFEKINGYKDGSFFTPGFITMYMCRETIRKSVVHKFNEVNSWKCQTIDDLYEKIDFTTKKGRDDANLVVNSIKICDPAVGSGHYLVSALNEMISVKNDLKILQDRDGKRLKEYQVEVVNDELIITDDEGELFEYTPLNKESQRIQETLFHEKQTIIENCLFGVDINSNSAKICRLRLWIELLKNAYYKNETELETLPNIDINIKCGNSLVSRFSIDSDLKQALKSSNRTIDGYRHAVDTYRNAQSKDQKNDMKRLISDIKSDFRTNIDDPFKGKLSKARGAVNMIASEINTRKQWQEKLDKTLSKEFEKASEKLKKLEIKRDEIESNKIFGNAFEWRFEFPEVLNNDGDFVGFDVVIGNPPYGAQFNDQEKIYIREKFRSYQYKYDSYVYFIEVGINLLKVNGILEYITPILWLTLDNCYPIREIVIKENDLKRIFIHGEGVFDEAVVNTLSFQLEKKDPTKELIIIKNSTFFSTNKFEWIDKGSLKIESRISPQQKKIIDKIRSKSTFLSKFGEVIQGITPYDSYQGQSKEVISSRAYHFDFKKDSSCGKWLDGKNLNRYTISWDNKWLSYGDWLAAPREKRFFEGRRILFREVPGKARRIQAGITDAEYYYGHSISPFKPNDQYLQDLEYLLGIVNSKLVSWYGNLTLSNFGKDVFPKLNPNDIKELPIPSEFEYYKNISDHVKKIMMAKSDDQDADTIHLENEIDQLVYRLYNLAEEEIKIIENNG